MTRFLFLLIFFFTTSASAMTFKREGDILFLSGVVEESDAESFERQADSVKTVVFKDSPGGNANIALQIGSSIRFNKHATKVEGFCYSACALMYMAGVSRSLTKDSILGFHGATAKDGSYVGNMNLRLVSYLRFMSKDRISLELASFMFYDLRDKDLLLVNNGQVYVHQNGQTVRSKFSVEDLHVEN